MSKKSVARSRRNGGNCIYTGVLATSDDHVPPRSFLAKPYPANLIKVPACSKFNSEIAKDEQYLLSIFAQIIEHPAIVRRIVEGGDIDRTLARSPYLDDRITNQLQLTQDGRVAVRPEWDRVNRVLSKIAAGLFFVKHDVAPGIGHFQTLGLYNREDPPEDMVRLSWTMNVEGLTDVVQWSVFSYGFCKSTDFPNHLLCNMNFYDRLFGIVACPKPSL